MTKEEKIEILEDAFRSGIGHSRFECNCGNVFYNSNGSWDWEEGELEELNNSDATDLDYTVSTVILEGIEYCMDCICWHKKALLIFDFLISHGLLLTDCWAERMVSWLAWHSMDINLMG